jgi:hypothetical protein
MFGILFRQKGTEAKKYTDLPIHLCFVLEYAQRLLVSWLRFVLHFFTYELGAFCRLFRVRPKIVVVVV